MTRGTRHSRRLVLKSLVTLPALLAVGTACQQAPAPAKPAESKPAAPAAPTKPTDAAKPAAAQATTAAKPAAPGQTGAAKQFAGVTISGACFQHVYPEALKSFLPEFEEKTGMKVNLDLQAFPVYNQRADLELSTKGSAWDFLNITFIYSGRWIGAGWFHPVEEFAKDPNKTPAEWGLDDWPSGAMASLKDAKGTIHGYPWEAGAMINGAARHDLIEKAGLKLPTTFDEMTKVLEAVNDKDNVKAFVADKLHHWNWIPYLMGFGGNVFKAPPDNLTPTLDTPEAIKAAEWYANVLRSYTPEGVLSYTDDQAMTAQLQGRANMRTQAIAWMVPMGQPDKSQVSKTVGYALMPAGPTGAFPGSNSHGFGIPVGSKNKEAAWEFLKWAMSKEMVQRIVTEKGYAAPCRLSVIDSPEFKQKMTVNGFDLASLYVQVLDLGGKTGYMKYRTVPVFPQVGDKINKAIESIVTKQASPEDAMKQAQAEAISDLKKSGVKVDA